MQPDFKAVDDYVGLKYFAISLSNNTNYNTTFTVDGVNMYMRCGYNSRNKMRWIYLMDKSDNILLSQTFIKHNKRCELNFNANQSDLDYFVTLRYKGSAIKDFSNYDYLNWADDFELVFVGHEYSLTELMKVNIRSMYVGN